MAENTAISTNIINDVEMTTFAQTMSKIEEFQSLIKSHLTENHDYGIIPGTSKPTLLKPGAEKILMLLGLTSEFDILDSTRNFDRGFFQYQVKCRLFKNGVLITEGLGACNTMETKYILQDPYTLDNTVLKMAKKRALVDATLMVASLSQLFTQDIEDMDFSRKAKPAAAEPKPAGTEKKSGYDVAQEETISRAQARRMYAISKGNSDLCRKICNKYGYLTSDEVKKSDYEKICAEINNEAA